LPASAGIASMRRGGTANGKNGSGEQEDRIEK
jgi:hypothetical protein